MAHILNDEEAKAFFMEADAYQPRACTPTCFAAQIPQAFLRLAEEYRVIFRLIYCCGLRNAEACNLKWEDVDFVKKSMAIIHSKGARDRIIYLHDDMACLLRSYKSVLSQRFKCGSLWVFPGKDPEKHLPKTSWVVK